MRQPKREELLCILTRYRGRHLDPKPVQVTLEPGPALSWTGTGRAEPLDWSQWRAPALRLSSTPTRKKEKSKEQ